MQRLRAVPGTEQIVGGTTTFAPMGHAVILAGVAQWDRHVRPAESLQILVPYLRICPSRRAVYRLVPEAGAPGISDLLEGLHRTLTGGDPMPAELRKLRWKDVAQPGQVDAHFVASWADDDTAWDLDEAIGGFFSGEAAWLENLGELVQLMPLALYLDTVQRRLRAEMNMPVRATPDEVAETALRGLRLHGTRPKPRFGEAPEAQDDDLRLSQVHAVDQAMDVVGRKRFRRRGGVGLSPSEYRALALLSLDGRLPPKWPASGAVLEPVLQQLRLAQRRRREPYGEAQKRFASYWSRPWAVPFPRESFVCARTREDVAWELAKWTRTRVFLRKRWVLGGGRHAVLGPAGPDPMTRLWESFHYLGGREVREDLRLVGGLRSWLLAFPEKPLSVLTTDIAIAANALAGGVEDPGVQASLQTAIQALMEPGAALGVEAGPVMVRGAAGSGAER